MAIFHKCYGDATGPLGLPMESSQARALEDLLKGASAKCRDLGLMRCTPDVVKAPDPDKVERTEISFVTTNSLDRDREVVLAKGGDWKTFMKNPVVQFAHDYSMPPIGKALWVRKDTKGGLEGWAAKTLYAKRPDTHPAQAEWVPDTIWHFVSEGFMPGKSIGFIPLNYRPPEEKEIKANPSWAKARGVIDKWVALEYSVTPVQSNPDALVTEISKMAKKGMSMKEFYEAAGFVIPDATLVALPQKTAEQLLEEKLAGKFKVYTPPPPVDLAEEFRKRAVGVLKKLDPMAAIVAASRGRV